MTTPSSTTKRRIVDVSSALLGALIFITLLCAARARAAELIVVSDAAGLVSAVAQGHRGQTILARSGTYELNQGIILPDGVTLMGEGTMQFDSEGNPSGIDSVNRTLLKSTAGVPGDFIVLGDGAAMRSLVVEDCVGRAGNVVAILSRSPGDRIAASIDRCEILNPNPIGASPQGPRGRAVLLLSRNLNLGDAPLPHDGSSLSLAMTRSLIRSPNGGTGVMAVNFASRCRIDVRLESNVIGGGLDSTAAASRPDEVHDSAIFIESASNVYRADSVLSTIGWLIGGGTDAPLPGIVAQGSTRSRMCVTSAGDVIHGFQVGIFATAGRRNGALAGASSFNEVQLSILRLSLGTSVGDLWLFGERSDVPGMVAGDQNELRVHIVDSSGSGIRSNRYGHELNLISTATSSRLEVVGSPVAFEKSNRLINPPPPADFFTHVH